MKSCVLMITDTVVAVGYTRLGIQSHPVIHWVLGVTCWLASRAALDEG